MDKWSATLKDGHYAYGSGNNSPLQMGWAASFWPAAAEIIVHTYGRWPGDDRGRFSRMLKTQYLPTLIKGMPMSNGNWELIITQALMSVAVYLDDRAAFD